MKVALNSKFFGKIYLLFSIFALFSCSSEIEYADIDSLDLKTITNLFTIDAKKSGISFDPESETIKVGESIDLYFINKNKSTDNSSLGAKWILSGSGGSLTIDSNGVSSKFIALKKGSTKVYAEYRGEVKFIEILIVNSAPNLDSISNQSNILQGLSISTINASDNGLDKDADGETITYSCYYDLVLDGLVSTTTSCSTLSGLSFNSSTGVLDWTTQSGQVNNYEFKILASDGIDNDEEVFEIEVVSNVSPIIDLITNQSGILEGNAITQINANDGGDDIDGDGDIITYSCYYDLVIDSTVSNTNLCSTISGLAFNSSTGVMDWTTNLSQAGNYEFKIIASDGISQAQQIFTIEILSDDSPVIDTIQDNLVAKENVAISINASDGGDDFDGNGDALTYTCRVDNIIDNDVSSGLACTSVSGLTFNTTSGELNWTPSSSDYGKYEFSISATDGIQSDEEIFVISVINPSHFVSTWRTTTPGETITLALRSGFNYNFTVDWGDGSSNMITSFSDTDKTHTYTNSGDHVITIYGLAEAWHIGDTGDKEKIISVSYLGDLGWISLEGAFLGANNLVEFTGGTTTNVTNMSEMFRGASSLSYIDLSDFNTSNVTSMNFMFYGCGSLTTLDLSSFDTSKVTSFSYMFGFAGNITSLDISSFDTSIASTFYAMFLGLRLTTLDLSHFNTSNVSDFRRMFMNMTNLTNLDISNFNTSNATSMDRMFGGLQSLTSLDLSHFNTSNVVNMEAMFINMNSLVSLNVSSFDTSEVTNMSEMFMQLRSLTSLNLSNFDTSKVTDMSQMFRDLNVLTTLDLSSFNTANVTSMSTMFLNMTDLTTLDISSFNTSSVITMSGMFRNVESLLSLDLSHFNTTSVIDMSTMFADMTDLTTLDISNFNTSNVTDFNSLFLNATSLSTIDVSSFNTASAINMSAMFQNTNSLTSLDLSIFNTANVTDMSYMFADMSNLTTLDISNFNTLNITSFNSMFLAASSLTSLDLSHFDSANVTDLSSMFKDMDQITSLNISNFNTTNTITMSEMFSGNNLSSLDLSHFDTVNVTDMSAIFKDMDQLTSLNILSFDTSKVTTMNEMFNGTNLSSLDLSHFDTSNVTDMGYMFAEMTNLNLLDLSSFDVSKVTIFSYMFSKVSTLSTLDLSNFITNSATDMSMMFNEMSSLTLLDISSFDTANVISMQNMFNNTSSISSLDLSHFDTINVTNMRNMFNATTGLSTVDASGWDITNVIDSTGFSTSSGAIFYCDQGGSPGTGSLFGQICN